MFEPRHSGGGVLREVDGMDVYRVFYWSTGVLALMGIMVVTGLFDEAKEILVYGCVAGVLAVALVSMGFQRFWNEMKPSILLIFGLAFIIGGAAFDIYATLRHSPDLMHEANPFARTLLDNGASLKTVMISALLAQVGVVFVSSMIWANFVARLEWYRNMIRDARGIRLLGKVLGARDNRWSSLLGARVRYDVFVSSLGMVVLALFAYRWYLGMEWFGWVPVSRVAAPTFLLSLALAFLLVWGRRVAGPKSADA